MSDAPNEGREETQRIEKDADNYCKDSQVCYWSTRNGYIAGATAENNRLRDQLSKEREKAIDECKKIVHDFQATTIENMMAKLESLKYRI